VKDYQRKHPNTVILDEVEAVMCVVDRVRTLSLLEVSEGVACKSAADDDGDCDILISTLRAFGIYIL
jgi:hypothetical protein